MFADVNHIVHGDSDNADGEVRITVLGFSSRARVLFVVAFEVEVGDGDEDLIRIIGARRADPQEEIVYASESEK